MIGNIAARCLTRWASHADGQEKARIYRAKSEIELTELSVNFQGGVLNPLSLYTELETKTCYWLLRCCMAWPERLPNA